MQTLRVRGDGPEPEAIAAAVGALDAGELIVYPTDTLYALGASALNHSAVARLRSVKRREAGKPLPLVAADQRQAESLCAAWPKAAGRLAEQFWPGPLSLVLASASVVPTEVTAGRGTVAIRVPALELTRRLCDVAGPLVSTSANVSGGRPPMTCAEALNGLADVVALALDAGPGRALPSTIVDVVSGTPRLVREGAVPWAAIEASLSAPAS
jgi:L-threonylcarbamoyladenylate synthase